VDWICLVQVRDTGRALVNAVMNAQLAAFREGLSPMQLVELVDWSRLALCSNGLL
jgi:hypothetical protein